MYLNGEKPEYWRYIQSDLTPKALVKITLHIPKQEDVIEDVIIDNFTETEEDFLMSFSHQRSGDLISNTLPRNTVEFTVCNVNGKWDPANNNGLGRKIALLLNGEIIVSVEYGFCLPDGRFDLIPCGRFCLKEFSSDADGLQAQFKAVDALEYLLRTPFDIGYDEPTLIGLLGLVVREKYSDPYFLNVKGVVDELYSPSDSERELPFPLPIVEGETCASVYKRVAHALCKVINFGRLGEVWLESLPTSQLRHEIPLAFSYSYPKLEKRTLISEIRGTFPDGKAVFLTGIDSSCGETITVSSELVPKNRIESVMDNTYRMLSQQKISGEYRGDLLLDLYDRATVETKYGYIQNVVLTNITITFSGSFRTMYEGYIFPDEETGQYFFGEIQCGEVADFGDSI